MRRLISACLLSLSLLAASSVALAQVGSEQQLKAAFIVNFLKYVEWPEANRGASICLFGRDTLGANLASFEGRTVGGYELVVRRVLSPDQMAGCQIVFVPEVEDARYGAVLRWLDGQPVLTVSDGENFARLAEMRDARGRKLDVLRLPQPEKRMLNGLRLTLSYTNFFIANGGIVMSSF